MLVQIWKLQNKENTCFGYQIDLNKNICVRPVKMNKFRKGDNDAFGTLSNFLHHYFRTAIATRYVLCRAIKRIISQYSIII